MNLPRGGCIGSLRSSPKFFFFFYSTYLIMNNKLSIHAYKYNSNHPMNIGYNMKKPPSNILDVKKS